MCFRGCARACRVPATSCKGAAHPASDSTWPWTMRPSRQKLSWLSKRVQRNKGYHLPLAGEGSHDVGVASNSGSSRRTSKETDDNAPEETPEQSTDNSMHGRCNECLVSQQQPDDEQEVLNLRHDNLLLTRRVAALEAELSELTLLPPSLLARHASLECGPPGAPRGYEHHLSRPPRFHEWLTTAREDAMSNKARQSESSERAASPRQVLLQSHRHLDGRPVPERRRE